MISLRPQNQINDLATIFDEGIIDFESSPVLFPDIGQVSVIMPCYNEGKFIAQNITITFEELKKLVNNFEIIAVNDGSTDDTLKEIKKVALENSSVKMINCEKNQGKGNALKQGVMAAQGEYIIFLDSDLDLHPSQLNRFFQILIDTNSDAVIGSKLHPESELNYPIIRRIFSFSYYIVLKILFNLNVRDTQTGLKLFKTNVLKPVFEKICVKGFAYDIEVLAVLQQKNCKIEQAPIKLVFRRETSWGRIKIRDILEVAADTFAIFHRLHIKHYYD